MNGFDCLQPPMVSTPIAIPVMSTPVALAPASAAATAPTAAPAEAPATYPVPASAVSTRTTRFSWGWPTYGCRKSQSVGMITTFEKNSNS